MRFVSTLLLFAAIAAVAGCPQGEIDTTPHNTVEVDGLAVSIELPTRNFTVGDRFEVIVTAANTSGKAMEILAGSGAPVYLRIWRHTGLDWEEVKQYPRSATMIMTAWRIEKHAQRRFVMPLTVEPDWPTGEILAMSAELNGRKEASPQVIFEVSTPVLNPAEGPVLSGASPQPLEGLP